MNRQEYDDDVTVSTDVDRNTIFPLEMEGGAASLPAAEEVRSSLAYRNSQAIESRSRSSKRTNRYLWCAATTVLLTLILVVSLNARRNTVDSTMTDREKTKEEAKRRPRPTATDITTFLTQVHNISERSKFADDTSPQSRAARFMANEDGANLPVPSIDSAFLEVPVYEFIFRYVMILTYYAMGGDGWTRNPAFLSDEHVCDWSAYHPISGIPLGVFCAITTSGWLVPIALILPDNNLTGRLVSEIGKLPSFYFLQFRGNAVTGEIPSDLCHSLPFIDFLGLGHNQLRGTIPGCLGSLTSLRLLVLANNSLEGSLPTSFADLSLEHLYIDDNQLVGNPIPVWNQMTSLEALIANNNNFTATIDETFLAQSPNMTWVDVSHANLVSTSFPEHLLRLERLNVLDLSKNRLQGTFPTNWSVTAFNLEFLGVYDNQLSGPLTGLGQLSTLKHLDVSKNNFNGSMEAIASLSRLELLFLSENPLEEGTIPANFSTMVNLIELSLRNTNRIGALPEFVNTDMELLDFGSNRLNGTIPQSYGNYSNLAFLLVNNNTNISGALPRTFSTLNSLKGGFFDGTSLNNDTIEILCDHINFAAVDHEEVIAADCTIPCPCNANLCTCCDRSKSDEGCSRPELNNVDASWETLFRRESYAFRNYSADFVNKNLSMLPDKLN